MDSLRVLLVLDQAGRRGGRRRGVFEVSTVFKLGMKIVEREFSRIPAQTDR